MSYASQPATEQATALSLLCSSSTSNAREDRESASAGEEEAVERK